MPSTSPAAPATKPSVSASTERVRADDEPPKPLDPDAARASIVAGVRETRARASEAAGMPLDGSGRQIAIIDTGPNPLHGTTVRSAVSDPKTGVAPGATTSLSFLPDSPDRSMSALLSDTHAWSGTADPKAVSRELKSAQAAVDAGAGTPRDLATLGLAQMAALMRAMKAGTDDLLHLPLNTGTPVPLQKSLADMLDAPGSSPVAQAARQAVDDWAASAPSDLLRGERAELARELNLYADKLKETKNPDPSKAAFVSTSLTLERRRTPDAIAYASLLSPAWRAKHGLAPIGGSASPEQTQRGQALVEARKSEVARAMSETVNAADVVKARQRIESVVRKKLADENMAMIIASGNSGNAPGSENLFHTPGILSVGATTDGGESFDPSDRTMAGFSNAAEVAAPGLAVVSGSPGRPPEAQTGTSLAAPHVAGVAALVSQAAPHLSARQVLDILKSTAVPATGPNSDRAGAGVIDVAAAVRRARAMRGA